MNLKNLSIPFFLLGALACTSEDPAEIPSADGGTIKTLVRGRAFYLLGGVRDVVVHQVDPVGIPKGELCRAQTNEAGAFECALGPYEGPALVEISLAKEGGRTLRTYLSGVKRGGTATVVISPFTHLAAQWVTYRRKQDGSLEQSLREAEELIYGHFGAINHGLVVPADLRAEKPGHRMHPETSGVLLESLGYLARTYPTGTLWDLITTLSADLRTDGVFDGLGDKQLEVGGVALTGETLRADLGRAMIDWANTAQNRSPYTAADLMPLAERLANNTSRIFPAKSGSIDRTPPMVVAFQIRREGEDRANGEPVSGPSCDVSVRAKDSESAIAQIEAEIEGYEGVLSEDRDGLEEWARFDFDSTDLPDGLHRVRMRVSDDKGNQTAWDTLEFRVDNTRPAVQIDAPQVVRTPSIMLVVTSSDSSERTELKVVSPVETKVVQKPAEREEVTIRLGCGGASSVEALEVSVRDAAHNTKRMSLEIHCDTLPPGLNFSGTPYLDETELEVSRVQAAPNRLNYTWRRGAPPQPQNTANAQQPYIFKKYFTRLDSGSENIPVFSWWVNENAGATVEYRYLIDGSVEKDWTVAPEGDQPGYYPIEVSYQSLTQALGRHPVSAIHRVEFRVQDRAGNGATDAREFQMELLSPPVWVKGCDLARGPGELGNLELASRNVEQMYQPGRRTTLGRGTVEYILGLPANSLAPKEGISFGLVDSQLEGEITHLQETAHYGPYYRGPGGLNDPYFCAPRTTAGYNKCHSILERTLPVPVPNNAVAQGILHTFDHPKDQETEFHIASQHGRISDYQPETVSTTLLIAGAPVTQLNADRWEVAEGRLHSMQWSVDSPRLSVAGSTYRWGTSIRVPQAYVLSQVPERYQIEAPQWFRSGVEQDWTDSLNVLGQQFVARPYISGMQWDVLLGRYEAEALTPHDAHVPIVVESSCQSRFSHTTRL